MASIHSSKGQATIEFTLVFVLLLILTGAAVDWGLAFFVSHMVQNSAREGARAAATRLTPGGGSCTLGPFTSDPCESEPDGTVLKEAANRIPNVGLFSGFTIVNDGTSGTCPNQEVTVTVSGTHGFWFLRLINAFIGSFPDSVTISRSVRMRWERQSIDPCKCTPLPVPPPVGCP